MVTGLRAWAAGAPRGEWELQRTAPPPWRRDVGDFGRWRKEDDEARARERAAGGVEEESSVVVVVESVFMTARDISGRRGMDEVEVGIAEGDGVGSCRMKKTQNSDDQRIGG